MAYTKRPLTDNVALIVVTDDIQLLEAGNETLKKLTKPCTAGELASQVDACPVTEVTGLRERVGYLKEHYDGFRIRNAQLTGVLATDNIIDSIDENTAEYLRECGSIAVIAKDYKNDADRILLSKGILPLKSEKTYSLSDFILLRNMKKLIYSGELDAILVYPDKEIKTELTLGKYSEEELSEVID